MPLKSRRNIVVLFTVTCVCLAMWSLNARFKSPMQELRVESIRLQSVSWHQQKLGYDTRIQATIISQGPPPQLKNHQYAGGDLIARNTRLVQIINGTERKVTSQPPRFISTSGNPSTVSFLISKAKLPQGKILLRSTIGYSYAYNVSNKAARYDSPGVPIEFSVS